MAPYTHTKSPTYNYLYKLIVCGLSQHIGLHKIIIFRAYTYMYIIHTGFSQFPFLCQLRDYGAQRNISDNEVRVFKDKLKT